ncbi:cohesin domain-containing protein [Sporosarcina ureae]|uniref:Cohesin domain-containing protein n=1 Tax=Sporosarcina ureae TaxID=1571 RepID=A0ABM6JXI6_SPOUR|nr:cohesin domain-containing protein [Sporosarcina ureae]ARF14920.1 hypothetical protein SporoS204_12605 [Sporosarcina ureae]
MKKLVKILLVLSLLFYFAPTVPVNAQTKTVIGVSTVYEQRATTVEFSIFIDSMEEVAAGSFDLEYDPELLTVNERNVSVGESVGNYLTSVNAASAGNISFAFAKSEGQKFEGDTLLTIKATVRKSNMQNNLKLNNVHILTKDGKDVSKQIIDGAIKPFDGETKNYSKKEKAGKEWHIKLSKPYDPATLNHYAVTVRTSTKIMEIKITPVTEDTFKVTPITPYARGNYTIEVTEQLHSANGTKLNKPIRQTFTVE